MKIAFYHELATAAGVGMREVLTAAVPASGSMGRIWVAVELAKLGQEVYVFHRALTGPRIECILGVNLIKVTSDDDFVEKLRSLGDIDCVVVNFIANHLPLVNRLVSIPSCKILCANCNPPFEWCDLLDQKRLHRMVCVSNVSREPFRLHRNFRWVDYVHGSMNAGVPIPLPEEPLAGSVAFLGALREEKGFHHVLRAWPLVRNKLPDARLFVCGSIQLHYPDCAVGRTGVLTPEFEQKYINPWLGQNGDWRNHGIEFLYPLSKQALLKRLAQTMVGIVNPNLTGSVETFCLSAVEMQACGCPSIGGGVGGLLETIADGISGFHLRTQRPEELAGRIIEIISNRELRTRLSQGALKHSTRLASAEREARDWIRVFDDSIQSIPSSAPKIFHLDCARALGAGRAKIILKALLKKYRA